MTPDLYEAISAVGPRVTGTLAVYLRAASNPDWGPPEVALRAALAAMLERVLADWPVERPVDLGEPDEALVDVVQEYWPLGPGPMEHTAYWLRQQAAIRTGAAGGPLTEMGAVMCALAREVQEAIYIVQARVLL